jgi:hypothetical protein
MPGDSLALPEPCKRSFFSGNNPGSGGLVLPTVDLGKQSVYPCRRFTLENRKRARIIRKLLILNKKSGGFAMKGATHIEFNVEYRIGGALQPAGYATLLNFA